MKTLTEFVVDFGTQSQSLPFDATQQTADSRQQTADSRQQTADSRQQTADILTTKLLTFIVIILTITLTMITPVIGDQVLPENMVEITNFEVVSNDTLSGGDSILVNFSFISQWECKMDIAKGLFGCFSTFEDTLSTRNSVLSDTISVQPDSTYSFSYYVRVNDSGIDLSPSSITLCTKVILDDDRPLHPLNSVDYSIASKKYKSLSGSRELTKIYSPYWCTYVQNEDILCQTYDFQFISGTFTNPPVETKNIKISGQLVFYDWYEPKKDDEEYRVKGAFSDIWLFFERNGDPNVLIHPVPYFDGNPILNVHYAQCDNEGNFEFEFDYKLDSLIALYPPSTWRIKLYIAKENKAILMNSDNQHARINGIMSPYRDVELLKIYYHPLLFSGFNPQNDLNINIGRKYYLDYNIGDDEACIFRHATLSRKFLQERLELDESSPELPIQTSVMHRRNLSVGGYISGGIIFIKTGFPRGTIHEYGHYYHYKVGITGWTDMLTTNNRAIIEGWAIFFTDAVFTWMKRNYGDRRDHNEDCEIAPFCKSVINDDKYLKVSSDPDVYEFDERVITGSPRFSVLSKVTDPNIDERWSVKFASYLWNIYDSNEDVSFMAIEREYKNNDDINGLGKEIFDFFKLYNNTTLYATLSTSRRNPIGFHNEGIMEHFNVSDDVKSSINALYNFIEMGNYTTLVKQNNEEMISPQISIDVSYTHSDIDVSFSSNSYEFGEGEFTWYTSFMSYHSSTTDEWRVERKLEINWNFDNRETGTRVYLWDLSEQDWEYHSQFNYSSSNYETSFNNVFPAQYKITSFKTNGGEAVSPHILNIPYTGKRSIDAAQNHYNFQTIKNVFPNPVKESFAVNYYLDYADKIIVEIINQSGVTIHKEQIQGLIGENSFRININSVHPDGVYYVRLLNNNRQMIATKKIIKIR